MPFLAEHLWRNLVSADESVFLAPWPEAGDVDETLLAEVAEVRRVVELGRQARDGVGAEAAPAAAPARRRRARERGALARRRDRRGAARQGGRVRRGRGDRAARQAEPAACSARSSARSSRACAPRLQGGGSRSSTEAASASDGHELEPDEVLVERVGREGWAVAADDGLTVALDTALDDELRCEGRVLDLIHRR